MMRGELTGSFYCFGYFIEKIQRRFIDFESLGTIRACLMVNRVFWMEIRIMKFVHKI